MKLKIYPGKIKHINFKLILILSLMVVQVKAADFYTLTDQDVVVNNGIIESSSHDPATNGYYIIIPDSLDGQTVKGIADGEEDFFSNITGVFHNLDLIEVQLPATISYIGDYAFQENAITKISLPSSLVAIGRNAFYNNQIAGTLTIPNSVKTIGNNAFHTNQIDDIIFEDNSNLLFIASHAFVNNVNGLNFTLPTPQVTNFKYWIDWHDNRYQPGQTVTATNTFFRVVFSYTLTDDDVVVENGIITSCSYNFDSKFVTIPNMLDGQTVTGIADANSQKSGIFYGKTLLEINLPSTIETIGDFAFISNSIDTLLIPASTKSIGYGAFWGFSLDTVIFENNSHLELIKEEAFDNNHPWLTIALPSPIKQGYQFEHWEDSDGNIHQGGDIIPNYDLGYTAIFSLAPGTSIIDLSGDLDFGLVNQFSSATKTLTINNTGNAAFTVSDIQLPAGFSADWYSGTIAAESSQDVSITFEPTETKKYMGDIVISSDASSGTSSVKVSGEGKSVPVISISGDLNFGEVNINTSFEKEITIANIGSAVMNVSGIDLPTGFTTNWANGAIAAESEQKVLVSFSPVEKKLYEGLLRVNSNAGNQKNELAVSGTGVEKIISIELSGDLDFGSVVVDESSNKILTIKNTGDAGLEVSSIEIPIGFSTDWNSGSIATGMSQDVTISFNPQEDKNYSGKIIVHSNASSGSNEIGISGSGSIVSSLENGIENNKIYPNPTINNIHFTIQSRSTVNVYDIAGNMVLSKDFPLPGIQTINLGRLQKGMYLLSIDDDKGKIINQRIIKQ